MLNVLGQINLQHNTMTYYVLLVFYLRIVKNIKYNDEKEGKSFK